MSLTKLGDACACIPQANGQNVYRKIGAFFTDARGNTCMKIDTLPLSGSGWEGWVNCFAARTPTDKAQPGKCSDSAIPF